MPIKDGTDGGDLSRLFDSLRGLNIPPVERWQPARTLDIDLRIDANGKWFYRGSEIARRRLVKVFCSVLRRDEDGHYLVTPQAKYPVAVADTPFQAVEMQTRGNGPQQELLFRTNADDIVRADREHPLRVPTDPLSGQPSPRIEVRHQLQAKITRAVYWELANLLIESEQDASVVGVYSGGEFFAFGRVG